MKKILITATLVFGFVGFAFHLGNGINITKGLADLPTQHGVKVAADLADLPTQHGVRIAKDLADLPTQHSFLPLQKSIG